LTSESLELDTSILFQANNITLYRLARAKYANLSGIGAAVTPGRWNLAGREAIYSSTEMGVPLLERLVHTPKNVIPSNLAMMKIKLSGEWRESNEQDLYFDVNDGRSIWVFKSLARASAMFKITTFRSEIAMVVPSVIVPVWNVVLYPKSPGFSDHVSLESVDKFQFDPRLFPDMAELEVSE
jgi:RES domain-containing protein